MIRIQSLSHVQVFASPWAAARQAFLLFTITWSWLKLISIESVMPSNYLILCRPLLLLPSIFPGIRVFSDELALRIRWPRIGASASASVLPVDIQGWFPSGRTGLNPLTLWVSSTECLSPPGSASLGSPEQDCLEQCVPLGEGCFCLSLLSPAHMGPFRHWAFSKLLSAVAGLRLMPSPRAA